VFGSSTSDSEFDDVTKYAKIYHWEINCSRPAASTYRLYTSIQPPHRPTA